MSSDRYVINSVLRANQILESFTPQKAAYTNAELSKKLGLNKGALTRLLYTLEKTGFLERDSKSKEYRLTYRIFRIGNVYIGQVDLHREAMPQLSKLVTLCQETVHLAILNEFRVFYLDKVESPQSIRMISRIGSTSPAYCTGVGKILLAHIEEDELERFFRAVELKRYTPNTICDPIELKLNLKRIREQGYAIDDSEHEHDVRCVAAPIRDRNDAVIAAISISGPLFRMTREKMENEYVHAVKSTAKTISDRLGFLGMR
ncbi:MAG: IclR family transcriptional regulator [Deltaproteobacteria bacterium]|nr:MAG: IclR family transcriptional regulator [Deltaproteobacteria bacterium]